LPHSRCRVASMIASPASTASPAPRVLLRRQLSRPQASAAAAQSTDVALRASFDFLARGAGALSCCTISVTSDGNALVTSAAAAAGDLLLSVPTASCLVFRRHPDRLAVTSWATPAGLWPRVEAALAEHAQLDGLPWDIAAAAALLDAFSGDGGPLWSAYAQALLPTGQALTLPLTCVTGEALRLLPDSMREAAAAQRERLAGLLPRLAAPAAVPVAGGRRSATLAEAFALVRSRAFALAEHSFALVPIADLANHSSSPSAELLISEQAPPGADAGTDSSWIHLRCVRPLAAGAEVTFDYTQGAGYTNDRFMIQHGFVPRGGNRADRLTQLMDFEVPPLRAAWLQAALGDAAWLDMMLGGDAHLFAALKSLPLDDGASGSVDADEPARVQQLAAALTLRAACPPDELAAGSAESRDDEAEAAAARGAHQLAAALRYRAERTRLWRSVAGALDVYLAWLRRGDCAKSL